MIPHENQIPCKLWFGRKATVRYFKNFGSKYYIKNTNNNIDKFDDRADEGIFIRYYSKTKAYQCFNKILNKIVDSVDIKVDEGTKIVSENTEKYPCYDDLIKWDNEESKSKSKEKYPIVG